MVLTPRCNYLTVIFPPCRRGPHQHPSRNQRLPRSPNLPQRSRKLSKLKKGNNGLTAFDPVAKLRREAAAFVVNGIMEYKADISEARLGSAAWRG
ncbi:hypothetical protein ElyMa_006255700 [Elysia marginata]|uniref:Uncharacterized protein n=1 Tax=Elysia marginata TaxID=1093978 RepID=A0AAV4H8U1_9GAST|nr:hypothetical protein ElyMa_006255700 [Elysia marginata]